MKRFHIIFNQYIQYYIYTLIVLVIVFFFTNSPFVLGLIIGIIGSLINTFTFEYYLAKAKKSETIHISTGNVWRYLTAILACVLWACFKDNINIFGVIVGLLVSYVLVIFKPLIHKKKV
ncbi:ATP synthase subunit I [Staphylococcus sp. 18_1_E_LY]|uniref:ATP synthase subunit I n=1 Tax=Staphylococcus lloydii TaxID=2781774 RepID=A0A7T1FAD8_9STAP|nr:ATP synthase subunit I [Staphylococcus lloydii]MBF7020672.1 ATP synthase subunit I [Staphylococcus lloydii]MBF7028355.1 ATP synthase subunit I [Staphylococcus lloydii]MDU9419238.1 ATP synthase subunit I [Staphylococcus lloydii]QPM75923.1 ATP synthase subunit I [Staphylococcus lloydii]